MENTKKNLVNRNYRDRVFTDLFSEKKYTIQLLSTLHPEISDIKEEDVKLITIENVLTNQPYNDLAIAYQNSLMIFCEEQSYYNSNIPVRMFLYVADTLKRYLEEHTELNIFGERPVSIPNIELFTICSYAKNKEDYLYFETSKERGIKVTVQMIYCDETKKDIINQYLMFTKLASQTILEKGRTKEVLEEIVNKCINEGILKEYLNRRRKEVVSMIDILFDQETVIKRYIYAEKLVSKEEGKAEGIAEGKAEEKLRSNISAVNALKENLSIDDEKAMDLLNLSEEDKNEIRKTIRNYQDKS